MITSLSYSPLIVSGRWPLINHLLSIKNLPAMKSFLILILFLVLTSANAQKKSQNTGSFSVGFGNQEASLYADFFHDWKFGEKGKFKVGLGGRLTAYVGNTKYYTSAPSSLAGDNAHVDSLLFQSAQVNALNLALHLGYRIIPKLGIGANIDAIGFSFGGTANGTYFSNDQGLATTGKPTSPNIFMFGANKKGNLNCEFYMRYYFTEVWAIKMAYQHICTEYTTQTEIQQQPEVNDRFRNTSQLVSVGVTVIF
jgi:hypothetical protein